MTLRLNLGKYLEQHNISAYRVVQVSKLSPNTVYALARNQQNASIWTRSARCWQDWKASQVKAWNWVT
jgi:chorismate-pyruvate lyase